ADERRHNVHAEQEHDAPEPYPPSGVWIRRQRGRLAGGAAMSAARSFGIAHGPPEGGTRRAARARRVRSAPVDVVRGMGSLPLPDGPRVATVGFFDGVHLGHQEVLRSVVARARERGIRSVAITFDRHPREVLSPGSEPRLLTSVERKARLIESTGIDVLVVLAFDRDFSLIPAEDFVRDVLVDGVHAVHAVMGANFTFGFRALGTMGNLPSLGAPFGLTAETVQLVRT